MSNVLIDRNAVMDYLREQQANVIIEKNKNGFVNADVCDGMSSAIGAFMNFILQIPTAYDVDKVVERLEKRYMEMVDGKRKLCISDFYEYVIGVMKSGGIE